MTPIKPRKPQPWYASLNPPSWSPKHGRNRRPSTPSHDRPADRADSADERADAFDAFTYTYKSFITYPKPPAIPYAGVRAGEIIGYRLWYILDNHALCSLAHHFIWEPGAVIEGNIDERVDSWLPFSSYPIMGGVYSYSSPESIFKEMYMSNIRSARFPQAISFTGINWLTNFGVAYGTIKCWGEVVEHERGYRAQYARLHTIDGVIGCVDLDTLRSKYNV